MGSRTNGIKNLSQLKINQFNRSSTVMLYEITVEFNKDFLEISENEISIGIMSKPIRGQANLEIVKKLSKHFGVHTNNIRIKSGHKAKHKIVDILK